MSRHCFICRKETKRKVVYRGDNILIVRCQRCGLMFDELGLVITTKSFDDVFLDSGGYSLEDYVTRIDSRRELNKYWVKYIERYSDKGKILDVGCATGEFLQAAQKSGWETYGVEISRWASEKAKSWGEIYCGVLTEANYADNFFDAIRMSHVVMYMEDPFEELMEAYRILKPGGYLFIEEPNEKLFRWRFRLQSMLRGSELKVGAQLNLFIKQSLGKLLEVTPFRAEKIELQSFSDRGRVQAYLSDAVSSKLAVKFTLKLLRVTKLDIWTGVAFFIIAVAKK